MTDLICAAPDCLKAAKQGGCCYAHYQRRRRYGDFDTVKRVPFAARNWLSQNVGHVGDECLIWPFAKSGKGYGVVQFEGRMTSVQFAMCTLAHGERPTVKHEAAHSCGNGRLGCANPRHLRWDTRKGNMADQIKHGTRVRGSLQGSSKLSDVDVRKIRERAARELQKSIAADFNVSQAQVGRIVRRAAWAWLD